MKRANSDVEGLKKIFQYYESDADALFKKITWKEGDVENYDTLFSAMEGVEYVYHCAAMVDLGKNSQRMIDVNVGGTENIVRAALNRKVKKLCFVSSIAALSNGNENKPTDENTPFHENERTTLYGESKRLGEKVVHEAILKGLNAVTVNPGVIIGYSKNMTGSGELFKRVKKGLPFYTNGITGYVNVQDVVKAMIVLMKSEVKNERFVLVGENKTHKDVLRNIADGYGKYRPFIGMGKSLISISYALEMLGKLVGFTPLIDSSSARTSISKKRYSSEKFKKTFPDFQFSSIENTIHKICLFDK
jgi:nucleoside-diphosphate-sugar epimerase